jgi:hypothetical protein
MIADEWATGGVRRIRVTEADLLDPGFNQRLALAAQPSLPSPLEENTE